MSRQTLWTLLLALLLGTGLAAWSAGRLDDCDRYLRGDRSLPATHVLRMGQTGGQTGVEVPCTLWPLHQPVAVQALCLVLGTLVLVFVVSAVADVQRAGARKAERGW